MDGDRGPELWVRIYPDQIAVDSHLPDLTAAEVEAGKAYWDGVWAAGDMPADIEQLKGPWRTLAQAFNPRRAAWIAKSLTPLNAGQHPRPATPQYPVLVPRTQAQERAAVAAALPDHWTIVTYGRGGTQFHQGPPIVSPLAIGLSPAVTQFPPDLPVDEGMRWLVEFDAAEAAGMALRIPISPIERQAGFLRVIAYGLRATKHDQPGEDLFASLLESHHYTDGLAWVPQGDPTKNTPDASAAFSRRDVDYETSFQVERQAALTNNLSGDGQRAAALLGLPSGVFDHVQYSDEFDQKDAAQAAVALWPATLGYFLREIMAEVFSATQVDEARRWFMDNMRPRGPIPAFRVGDTPYGILPTTSLKLWNQDGGGALERHLVDFLRQAVPVWQASSGGTPRVGGSADPDQDLVGILGMDASSQVFRARWVIGDDFSWMLFPWLGLNDRTRQKWWDAHLQRGRALLDSFGFNRWNPRAIRLGLAPDSFKVLNPTVLPAPLSETDPLPNDAKLGDGTEVNYIRWLRLATPEDVQFERYPGTKKPDSLLYHILRQSLLHEYAALATHRELTTGRLVLAQVREPEFPNVSSRSIALTPWQVLQRQSVDRPDLTWADYLHRVIFPPGSPYGSLEDLRNALDWLATRPTAELDRLLTEFLDTCSHRLDAWVTALATSLLRRQRSQRQAGGVHLGAFGWVEDLSPNTVPRPARGMELESVTRIDASRQRLTGRVMRLRPPVEPQVDNGGFIYAPSLEQAAAGAVLRNGYLTHRQTSNGRLLAIDLSSARIRTALWMMDAMRQGQQLGALLGYRFERGLHEADRDLYAQPFRDLYPLVANKLTPGGPGEAVAASNVVDGVQLQRAWSDGKIVWGGALPAQGSADQTMVEGLFADLDDITDALSDLAVSESVYQAMRGNYGRAGGSLDGMARGERPPEPQIVDTVRAGLDLTHRVALILAGGQAPAAGWGSGARAAAEPRLDAWLGRQLPPPGNVRCHVTYISGGVPHRISVQLDQLGISPLDLLAMSATADTPQAGELELRIVLSAGLPGGASNPKADFELNQPADAGFISYPDTLFAARALADLTGTARPLEPKDLIDLDRKPEDFGGVVDLAGLRARFNTAFVEFDAAVATLDAAVIAGTGPQLEAGLLAISQFGVTGAIPAFSATAAELRTQAQAVLKVAQKRQGEVGVLAVNATAADTLKKFDQLFGGSLKVLPLFTPPDPAGLAQAFGESAALVGGDSQAPFRWIQQLTHVRPAISRLDVFTTVKQMLVDPAPPAFTIGQLPYQPGDSWLALKLPAAGITPGRVSLVTLIGGSLAQPTYAGLLVDEWPERIPTTKATAGLAFHYEEPKARAPQSLLLAVCPDGRQAWDGEAVLAILEETLELAKVRTVDLDSVLEVGQILPALYFAFNPKHETISFRPRFDVKATYLQARQP